ncbi:DUF928 domain-containing protein [Fischerella sp. PCC 9605]|uniref:DUF928 domain-containing protein n=1 Tax=Fischerella sp. PCC 9605 TaxID=1173024 RepID=UPI000684AB7D|nr:DUF928 domain-containing protein [Fischerella sp. PCC 9605]
MTKSKCALTITFALLCYMSFLVPVVAQSNQPASNGSERIQIRFREKEPDGSSRGRPTKRGGTGSRGKCPPVELLTTALIPAKNVALAVEEHPTFWFFVPYKATDVSTGEFVLQDEANKDVYRTDFTLPKTPGIVGLSLPSTAPLAIDKTYQWYFKLYCKDAIDSASGNLSNPVFVRGWVQRVALKPDLEYLLKSATTPRQRIAIYAENGIWYSALSELAKLRLSEPQNPTFNKDWAQLLQDVGLENLSTQPMIGKVKNKLEPGNRERGTRE